MDVYGASMRQKVRIVSGAVIFSYIDCLFRLPLHRKKLEYQNDNSPSSRVDGLGEMTRDVQPPEAESTSFMYEAPPWSASYEISATEADGVLLLP
jgi:hypothetical protein